VGTGSRRPRLIRWAGCASVIAALTSLGGAGAQATALPAALAFSRAQDAGSGVFVADRSGRVRLIADGGLDPAWSPDGRRLAYVAPGIGGLSDVYVVDADRRHRTPLTRTGSADESAPSWSRDGRRLVVEREGRLFVLRADRRGERLLGTGSRPAWSPKGGRIAFVRRRAEMDDLYLVDATGRGLRRLSTSPAIDSRPAWSPDGKRLAFVGLEEDATDLYAVDVASRTVARLTQDLDLEESPAWSPGGRAITFVSERVAGGPLWSVPARGGPAALLGGPRLLDHVAWRPSMSLELPPDLDQRPPTDLMFRRTPRGRFLLGFTSASDNVGLGPLSITASRPSRAVPTMRAAQRVRVVGGRTRTYPNVGVLRYTIAPPHEHWHLLDFQRYELRRASDHSLVVTDRKSGFCLADHWAQVPGRIAGKPRRPVFHSNCKQFEPDALAVQEGTSVGYTDRYPAYFHGQSLDVTQVPTGTYVLVHRTNAEMLLREARYENNAASLLVRLSWPRGRGNQPAIRALRSCPDSEWCGSASR
jgi:dipeptidyl aminopeptidase/acylaminoacyl peptidase